MAGPITKKSKASRFPAARIKKIMQMDEDVGKLASATPVMISKSLECFMQLMIDEAVKEARSRGSKKLTSYHLKHTINNTPSFDFLLDIASNISDPTTGEGTAPLSDGVAGPSAAAGPSRRKPSSSGVGATSATPGSVAPKSRKRKSGAGGEAGGVKPKPSSSGPVRMEDGRGAGMGTGVEMEMEDTEYTGRAMVRPGLGNLLNPSEEEKPYTGVAGSGGMSTVEAQGGGSGEGGRGMFDDYEDDDDY